MNLPEAIYKSAGIIFDFAIHLSYQKKPVSSQKSLFTFFVLLL